MKRVVRILDFAVIANGVIVMFSTAPLRLCWAIALAALVLTQITLWTALFLTGQHRRFKNDLSER